MTASLINVRALSVAGATLPGEPPAAHRVFHALIRTLDETPLCAWSTVAPDGTAHVNIGYFARSDEIHLYLLSHPASQHVRNVMANPSMAVAVFASSQNWTDPGRGVQLFGRCEQVAHSETPGAERIYGQRYQAYPERRAMLKTGEPALDYRFYRFVPGRLKILDETAFGDAVFVVADILRR